MMKKKYLIVLLAAIMVFALAACSGNKTEAPAAPPASSGSAEQPAGGASEEPAGAPLTVGFIYIGTVNDGGYTQAQHAGTLKVQETYSGLVKCVWLENIDDTNAQAATDAAKQLIDQGATVVIGTSFGFGTPLFGMAESGDYDDITFLHFSGSDINDHNFGNYFGAMEEPRYLSGIIAGLQTTSNKLGYVAAYPYTEVKIGINAFALGAQSVNPDATVSVVYTNSWYDPAGEKQAAEALLAQGCDVITQHADTAGPQIAAADAGALTVGYNLDNSGLEGLGDAFLTAPIWHHDIFLVPAIKAIMDGAWTPESYYGNMKEGYVDLAPLTKNVSDEARAKVEEVRTQIEAGSFPIFKGPISDNAGNEVVAEGETLDRSGIWQIEYLVKGVTASE
ncbi:MAG: BMP family ABC transporter substrate-binding protein [Clostridiales Family XIII bacterium]|jgi:basic membrane protein A|nr:BMP family ABC transporter substrate-binding protein [Clostridiales Family XIII bacterium]